MKKSNQKIINQLSKLANQCGYDIQDACHIANNTFLADGIKESQVKIGDEIRLIESGELAKIENILWNHKTIMIFCDGGRIASRDEIVNI